MDLALGALLATTAIALALVGRRLRDRERQLAELARMFDTVPTSAAMRTVAERRAAAAAAADAALDDLTRDRDQLGELLAAGVIRFGEDGRVDVANPAAHRLLGVAPGALNGRTAIETFADLAGETAITTARRSGIAAGEVEIRGLPEGPRTVVIRARATTERRVWAVLEDVTELRNLQRIRAEFVDNLSHELRTPITTVSLLAETLAREAAAADVPPRMRDRIAKIEVESGHLAQMVAELLDLARIEGGGSLQLVDGLDLGALATASVERLRLFAERADVALVVEPDPDLPPIRGDGDRLGQVIVNLVHNAVKFSDPGGHVRVTVRADHDERAGQVIAVAVADEGIGIPRTAQARIFERFYKVDRARVRAGGGGTGLGLAIARHVVEQHGGRIRVESEEGRGSVFTFSIPLAPDGPGVAPAATDPMPADGSA